MLLPNRPDSAGHRKKSTPRDLQTTAISQFSTVEQFLTPTTPSAPQTMFSTPIASMDVDILIVDAVPTDTASSAPLSDSSAVVKKRTSRPKPNKAPPPVIVTAGSPAEHPEAVRAAAARYQAEHPDVNQAAVARYEAEHPEVHQASAARYQAEHPEVHQASAARYQAEHPEVHQASAALR
ncbi:hypothetical protein ACLKA6_009717 [Drosophila palustris]